MTHMNPHYLDYARKIIFKNDTKPMLLIGHNGVSSPMHRQLIDPTVLPASTSVRHAMRTRKIVALKGSQKSQNKRVTTFPKHNQNQAGITLRSFQTL